LAELPPAANATASDALTRRRRGRNIAVALALIALSGLFYLITLVKLTQHGG
jgi:hypothetical protein